MRSSRWLAPTLFVLFGLFLALAVVTRSNGGTSQKPVVRHIDATKKQQRANAKQLRVAARQIGKLRALTWRCQDSLDVNRSEASTSVWALPQSVPYRIWVAHKWVARAKRCQRDLRQRTIGYTDDWLTAVDRVQRIYPGTKQWLLYISHREGGWGRFVMNTQGSGAGGWMQYMASTYYAYIDDAYADARRRGFVLPQSTNQWTQPLGQAVTAAYMRYTGRDGCHWCL